ncbi:hypothetical protein GCM10028862_03110 [Luteimonas pelagia]
MQTDSQGQVIDPYLLLGERTDEPELAGLEALEDEASTIADGGAAMVAYGLLMSGLLDHAAQKRLKLQLLRYCELDTLAMVMAWQGLNELCNARNENTDRPLLLKNFMPTPKHTHD